MNHLEGIDLQEATSLGDITFIITKPKAVLRQMKVTCEGERKTEVLAVQCVVVFTCVLASAFHVCLFSPLRANNAPNQAIATFNLQTA
ncbi:hypothetical protein V6N13_083801 [Hibiscus sabdariffa]